MNIINLILSNDLFTLFVIVVLGYLIYWVHQYRKLFLIGALVVVLGYVVFMFYTNRELFSHNKELVEKVEIEKAQTNELQEQLKMDNGFYGNSLGYTLNNPGNIRSGPNGFKKFPTMKHGFKAMAVLLHTYVNSGYNTLDKIINRWAPSSDGNNPKHYISTVSKNANVDKDYVITDADFKNGNMLNVMYFMTKVEQGRVPDIKDLYEGFNMFSKEKM